MHAEKLAFEEAMNEWSGELSACAAFYSTCLKCVGETLRGSTYQNFEALRKDATQLSYFGGAGAGLSQAAVLARYELAMKSKMADIDNDCKNISVLISKNEEACKNLLEKPSHPLNALIEHGPLTTAPNDVQKK